MSLSNIIFIIVIFLVVQRVVRYLKARKAGGVNPIPQTVRLISKGRVIEVVPLVVFDQPNSVKQVDDNVQVRSLLNEMDEDDLKRQMDLDDAVGNPANPLHDVFYSDK